MKTYLECVPCFIRQALDAAKKITDDVPTREKILRKALKNAAEADFSLPPPVFGQIIHRYIREETGSPDPYFGIKKKFNSLCIKSRAELLEKIRSSKKPLSFALKTAIAGNIIDFGAMTMDVKDLEESILHAASFEFENREDEVLLERMKECRSILYIADNAGEIILDSLFIETLPDEIRKNITLAVRGAPIINDATMEDAVEAGLTEIVRVITTGIDAPGVILSECSEEFREAFNSAEMIIAKGQGNYETLGDEYTTDIFFLLKVKCPLVAQHTGKDLMSINIIRNTIKKTGDDYGKDPARTGRP
ncbi:MAG: damage-control phosphatase ARMT1 family protein [Fibrobacterota bacterium]